MVWCRRRSRHGRVPVRSRACASGRSKDGFSTCLKNKLPRNLHSGFPL
ncbi:MAG: hypothetical protein IJC11_03085 [Alphaproteobacteria bacterium]|nr:hypothetical protein [Alphaproteobacteria bacterium]